MSSAPVGPNTWVILRNVAFVVMGSLFVATALLFTPFVEGLGEEVLESWRLGALLVTLLAMLAWLAGTGLLGWPDEGISVASVSGAASAPLVPLRLFFTLRHTTAHEVIGRAFGAADSMNPAALNACLERYAGFGEWPIKRPVEMRLVIERRSRGGAAATAPDRAGGRIEFVRRFDRTPSEVVGLHRRGDLLFQDNDVADWQVRCDPGPPRSVADLEGATIRLRATYLSFDDINFRQPPRFHDLHLSFGETAPCVLRFSERQLTAPSIVEDATPHLHGAFFKTLVLEYHLTVPSDLFARQLFHAPVASPHPSPLPGSGEREASGTTVALTSSRSAP